MRRGWKVPEGLFFLFFVKNRFRLRLLNLEDFSKSQWQISKKIPFFVLTISMLIALEKEKKQD